MHPAEIGLRYIQNSAAVRARRQKFTITVMVST
jgi:hypothetical protein